MAKSISRLVNCTVCGNEYQSIRPNQKYCGAKCRNTVRRNSGYLVWSGMVQRCTNPDASNYENYGGVGISVCERWIHSFEDFMSDMGTRPEGYTLDRVDYTKGYTKDNCRWADWETQSNNRRGITSVIAFGECLSVTQWARKNNISRDVVYKRLERGWNPERAVSKSPRKEVCSHG